MSNLAVVIMAFDEEDVLARCLESVKDLGELHVSVDSATTDSTEAIARQFTDNIYYHQGLPAEPPEQDDPDSAKALNSYARMRNDVFDMVAKGSKAGWFMWLDPDEYLVGGGEALLEGLTLAAPEVEAIAVPMRLLRRDGTIEAQLRNSKVIRRDVRFVRRRHEHIVITGIQAIIEECLLAHLPTQKESVRAAHDMRKTQQAAFMEDWREFRDGRAAFYIADWWRMQGQIEESLRWYEAGMALPDDKCPPLQRAQIATYMGRLYLANEQPELAAQSYHRAIECDWHYGEAFYYLGVVNANQKHFEEAKHWLNLALQYPDEPISVMQQQSGCTADLPYYGLASIAHAQGDRAEAYRLLDIADRKAPFPRPESMHLRAKLDED